MMGGRTALADTSVLIAFLDVSPLYDKLVFLYDTVYIPQSVKRELFKRRETKDKLKKVLSRRKGFFRTCKACDTTSVDVLKVNLGDGESEAIIQASEKRRKRRTVLLIDEKKGRKVAYNLGLEVQGTLGIIEALAKLFPRNFDQETIIRDLSIRGFYLPKKKPKNLV